MRHELWSFLVPHRHNSINIFLHTCWVKILPLLDQKIKRWNLSNDVANFFDWQRTKFGPKIKLKTEIERNENSIELLTLIFSLFTQSHANDRTICLSRADDGNWIVSGEKKILSHEKWMKFEKLLQGTCAVKEKTHSLEMHFPLFTLF